MQGLRSCRTVVLPRVSALRSASAFSTKNSPTYKAGKRARPTLGQPLFTKHDNAKFGRNRCLLRLPKMRDLRVFDELKMQRELDREQTDKDWSRFLE